MIDLKFLGRMGITMALAGMLCLAADTAGAIDVDLNAAAVKKAVEDGKQMKDDDLKTISTRFGANLKDDICGGGGAIRTKTVTLNRLGGAIARNPEQAEQDKAKIDEQIQKILDSKVLKIEFDFCGETADFAEGSSATLEQGGKMIKGEMAKPDKAKKNEKGPAYRGKIVASFPYSSFDPKASTKITLFPPIGDAMTWEVDFSKIR
jgi:hypothetical protein